MNTLFKIAYQVATINACALTYLAYTWVYDGTGLHPFIALPAAVLFTIMPHAHRATIE